jgi:hypothetical protein
VRKSLTEPSIDQASIHDYVTSNTTNASADSGIPLSAGFLSSGPYQGPPQFFSVSTRLIWNCAAQGCFNINNLTLCSTCKSAQYCSHAHLYDDRPKHRSVCTKIKKAQTNFEKEEKILRRSQDDLPGRWWLTTWVTHPARNYMRVRYTLVERLLRVNTAQAVASSLEHLLGMLQLSLAGSMGARDVVPVLYLRLGRDQEAYDFCHWWATTGHTPGYTSGSNEISYFATKNADIFEQVDIFTGPTFHLSHVITVTLSKLRLIIDLQSLQRAKALAGPYVPQEILEIIQQHSTLSAVTNSNKIADCKDHRPQIKILCEQVKTLFMSVHDANRHFWPALVGPGDNLQAQPTAWEHGDERQMQITLQHVYNAWAETPGAIHAIRELLNQ